MFFYGDFGTPEGSQRTKFAITCQLAFVVALLFVVLPLAAYFSRT